MIPMDKTCLIVEDNCTQRESMKRLVEEVSPEVRVFTADNPQDAYGILLSNSIDVFIVDIVLDTEKKGDISGVKMVNVIRDIPQYMFTPVIFVTSLEDPKLFAYSSLHCFSYMEKPYNREDAKDTIKKALAYTTPKKEQEVLCLRKEGILYPFKIDQIVYMESLNRSITVHKKGGEIEKMPYMTCRQILQEAANPALLQCARGVLVNRNYVKSIDKANRFITLKNSEERLDIGGTFLKSITDELCK